MERRDTSTGGVHAAESRARSRSQLIVLLVAAVIFLGCCISPPSLMDDVDAVQAQIAQNMLHSGDWVTARLDGVAYLEKSPLKYWMIAVSYMVFGVHDWAARIPLALCAVLLCWVTSRFAAWAFGERAGLYAGLTIATCVGLWLFTRILIPDVILTLTITLSMWSFLRATADDEPRPAMWAYTFWASVAVGLLLKGLIAAVFPIAAALLYAVLSAFICGAAPLARGRPPGRPTNILIAQFFALRPLTGILLLLLIAAPWHILATLRNPPYFDFTLHSESGSYHGFFWFYFINEHLLRFLNARYPRDYNTVPRWLFWVLHLLWLFPWSVYLPAVVRQTYRAPDRASRTRLLALCWAGFILIFFTFSTTQEYYSMPAYPAFALLLGSALAANSRWLKAGTAIIAAVASLAAAAIALILWSVRGLPTPGDISTALSTQDPNAYTLSLAHMGDLTLNSFAYLRLPLTVAGLAFLIGAIGAWLSLTGSLRVLSAHSADLSGEPQPSPTSKPPILAFTLMMVLFFHAARLALVVFDPYLSSRPLAQALLQSPPGQLIVDDQYYTFSSVFFYTDRRALLLNGRVNNLEYGSYAPDAPKGVFISDRDLPGLWSQPARYYLVAEDPQLPRLQQLVGKSALNTVARSGGKTLFTNF